MNDKTKAYFDEFTPHFTPKWFEFALEFIRNHSNPNTRLIDLGCGDGATLSLIQQNTPVELLTGMDISKRYLEKAKELTGCEAILGSILDPNLVVNLMNRYDFCLLGSVLHHLIGNSRRESYRAASYCLINTLNLLKRQGYIVIFEPTFSPAFLMDIIFYIKKFFSTFSDNRIELFKRWINIGQPIVSYYTEKQLFDMINSLENATIIEKKIVDEKRKGFVIKCIRMGFILQKAFG